MSDASSERLTETRFVLAPPPPLRSLAISAGTALIAAAMIVLSSALDLPAAVTIAAIVVLIFAIVLALVALVLTVRLTTLILDPRSITIIRTRHRRVVPWSGIDSVKMQGARVLLITEPKDYPDAAVVNPRGRDDATFAALVAEIQRRLNADRGYRPIS